MGMTLGRHIFETTLGKVILPWLNLGFTGAVCTLAAELFDAIRLSIRA
jgi:hypothetical protein